MKRIAVFFIVMCLNLLAHAQNQNASEIYAEFAKYAAVIQNVDPSSPEYEIAQQTMLHLFPLLQHHAAIYSQQNQTTNAMAFAKAYVDMAMMPQFQDMHLEKSEAYPKMTYYLASKYFNSKDYAHAVIYLQRYIDIQASQKREAVYPYLAKSYEKLGNKEAQRTVLETGLNEYPSDKNLLSMSINLCMENGWYAEALPYIERSLQLSPNDNNLRALEGQCLEGLQRYEEAVSVYTALAEQKKTLNIYKHYAVNLYNCAVQYYPTDRATATSYFQRVIPILNQVVATDPTSVSFTTALAMAYLYTDQYSLLAETNLRLRKLGAPEIASINANQPQIISSDIPRMAQAPSVQLAAAPLTATAKQPQPVQQQEEKKANSEYRLFVQNHIEKEIALWQQKDPYETISEYKERVSEKTRNEKIKELMQEAKLKYIASQKKLVRINDFKLQPYDAENRVFLINSPYGDIVLPVPRENNEARNLAATWKDVSIENPQFDIANDEMVIRYADFVTRSGKVYHYSDANEARYSQTEVALQFDKIDYNSLEDNTSKRKKVQVQKNAVTIGNSDVDINIPESKNIHTNRFAFLIGNENYQLIASVPFALHDVRTMKQYCYKTLGIPETNIRVYEDATFGKMLACVREIKSITEAYSGNVEIIFYYAGHGVPDEASKSAYLLPIDADGVQKESCYSVGRLYQELGKLGANSVIVMMDACFSGSQRGEGMLASARGVALKVKNDTPQGKMVTFSAATGEETAYPFTEQQHGMFTYYLLKGLQNSKGRINLGDLAEYVTTQVKQRSVVINHKMQTPTVNASPEATDWRKWNFK